MMNLAIVWWVWSALVSELIVHTHWTLALISFCFVLFRDSFCYHFEFCLVSLFIWFDIAISCTSNYNNFQLSCPFVIRIVSFQIIFCVFCLSIFISLTFIISICFSPLVFVYSRLHSFIPMVFIYFCTFIQYS